MLKRLWKDDAGVIISSEYILIAGLLTFGLGSGMVALRDSTTRSFEQIGKNLESVIPQDLSHLGVSGSNIRVQNKNNNSQNQNLNNYNYVIVNPRQP